MVMKTHLNPSLLATLLSVAFTADVAGQSTTSFTHSGRLLENGQPANGLYEMEITLHRSETNTTAVGSTVFLPAVPITNGLFMIALDFGPEAFDGELRWLEFSVGPSDVAGLLSAASVGPRPLTVLGPRQPVRSVPQTTYATKARTAVVADTATTATKAQTAVTADMATNAVLSKRAEVADTAVMATNAVMARRAEVADTADTATNANFATKAQTAVTADMATNAVLSKRAEVADTAVMATNAMVATRARSLDAGTYSNAVSFTSAANSFTGNAGGLTNVTATSLVGILPQALIPANVPRANSNVTFTGRVTFNPDPSVAPGLAAAPAPCPEPFTVTCPTKVNNLNADLLDGLDSTAFALLNSSPVFSGAVTASGDLVGARLRVGSGHDLTGPGATIAGGQSNSGGGALAAIGGGERNRAENAYSTVSGGLSNFNSGAFAVIPGGRDNRAVGSFAFAAGRRARALHQGAFVWGDSQDADFASTANNQFLIRALGGVGIGLSQPLYPLHVGSTLGTAAINFAGVRNATENATANGRAALLALAGPGASVSSDRVEVQMEAQHSTASASRLGIMGTASAHPLEIRTDNQARLTLAANGNLSVNPANTLSFGNATRQMLNLWGTDYGIGVQADTLYYRSNNDFSWFRQGTHNDDRNNPGGGTELMRLRNTGLTVNGVFVSSSDRAAKENFQPVNPGEVLDKVAALPLSQWNFKEDPAAHHIGPAAQDFHAAFGLNGADDKHIATVDADGVALAAIQGLNQKLEEQRQENGELKRRLAQLEQLVLKLATKAEQP